MLPRMDSNHRCLGVGQKSSPLDHGINIKVDSSGIAPESSVCRTDVFLLDHEPELLIVAKRKPWDSNPQAGCTRRLFSIRSFYRGLCLHPPYRTAAGLASGRMTSVVKLRELESNQRLRVQSPASLPAATIPQWISVEGHNSPGKVRELRGQESNLRTRGSKPRISTSRNYPASWRGTGGTRTHARVLNKHLLCR